ncbi:MAG TPA: hypothetical protein VGA42_10080 [Gemmatimonadales bacterium]|jgi:hypothetical protein
MSKLALVAALLLFAACLPKAEESAPAEQAPSPGVAPVPLDSATAPSDTMARDTATP